MELRDLQMALATYRLAFGQPRQEELIAFLEHWYPYSDLKILTERLKIELGPSVG